MTALIVLGVVASVVVALAVIAHRQDVRRKQSGVDAAGRSFRDTQAERYGNAGYSGDGMSGNPGNFGGPGL